MKKYALLLIFPVIGIILMVIVTRNFELGITPDSVSYIKVAESFLNGKGLVDKNGELVTHWPPMYPILLSYTSSILGLNVTLAAKYFSALMLTIVIIMFNLNLSIIKFDIKSKIILNTIFLFSSFTFVFFMIWSEGLFIGILLAALFFFLKWIKHNYVYYLLLSAFMCGLMILTRYAGIGIMGGFMLFILLFNKKNFKQRVIDFVKYIAIVFAIFSIWLIFTQIHKGNTINREFIYHPISFSHIKSLVGTVVKWILPVFILFILFIESNNLRKSYLNFNIVKKEFIITVLSLMFVYIIFLIFSISFFDAHTSFNNRILSPVYVLLILLIAPFLNKIFYKNIKKINILFLLMLSCMCYMFFYKYMELTKNGYGYSGIEWVHSEIVKASQNIESENIYTNGEDVLELYLNNNDIKINTLPELISPYTLQENKSFDLDLNNMKKSIIAENGILIFFNNLDWRYYYPDSDFILQEFSSYNIQKCNDGFVIMK